MTQALIKAYEKGFNRGHASDGQRRDNPFMPSTQEEKWQAWNIGFDEASPCYKIKVDKP